MRGNKQLTSFLQKNRFIYPFFISFLISALTFPPGPGMFQVKLELRDKFLTKLQ
jgi:hypothetical protein